MTFVYRALIAMRDESDAEDLARRLYNTELDVDTCTSIEDAYLLIAERHYNVLILQDSMGRQILDYYTSTHKYLQQDDYGFPGEDDHEHPRFISFVVVSHMDLTHDQFREVYRAYRRKSAVEDLAFLSMGPTIKHIMLPYLRRTRVDLNNPYPVEIRFVDSLESGVELDTEKTIDSIITNMFDSANLSDTAREAANDEFEDLLSRLMQNYSRIDVVPLKGGFSGSCVLLVKPYQSKGNGEVLVDQNLLVIKIDKHQIVYDEYDNYKTNIEGTIPQARHAFARDFYRTTRLGEIVYSFVGNEDSKPLQMFEDVYLKTQSLDPIYNIIDILFENTCHRWYTNPGQYVMDIADHYRRQLRPRQEKIAPAIESLTGVNTDEDRIFFDFAPPDEGYVNPLDIALNLTLNRDTYRCTIHGDLNPRNILVNPAGESWLIDFQFSGWHHAMHDFASLDVALRIQLLRDDLPLEARIELEQALLATSFDEFITPDAQAQFEGSPLLKPYLSILHLRKYAHKFFSDYAAKDDLLEYYVPLMYYTLRLVQFKNLAEEQRLQALFSASQLATQIDSLIEKQPE